VSVGRLVAKKEFSLLLDAVMQIQKKGLLVNIMIVGDGPERSALENKAAAYGVNLALPGACYGEEFLSLCFGSAAVAVIPGAAGLLVIHSMSYGTSVIVHDDDYHQKPEASAVEDCLTGNKFKRGNVNSLAAAITNVLSGSPSSEKVTAACRKIIESYWSPRFMRSVFDKAVDALPAVSVKESHIRSN
jgi:Glycosyltransferase